MVFHVEVSFSGFPFFTGLGQERADEAQQGGFVGKQTRDAGAAFEFHVDPFQRVARAQPALMRGGKGEDGQTLREIFLHPVGQPGRGGGVSGNDFLEPGLGAGQVGAVENAANGLGNFGALIQARDISLGILLEMELAALPRHGGEHGGASGAQAGMVIADQQ